MQENKEKIYDAAVTNENLETIPTEEISLGKFKSVKAIVEAYQNLEKEFTKKCQLLKEVEQRAEIQSESKSEADDKDRLWREKVNSFMQNYPIASQFEGEIAELISDDAGLADKENCLELALVKAMSKKYVPPCEIIKNNDFLEEFVYPDAKITGKIIDDYLKKIIGKQPPRTISSGGQTAITPPSRPKSLVEAGEVMQEMLFNRRNY